MSESQQSPAPRFGMCAGRCFGVNASASPSKPSEPRALPRPARLDVPGVTDAGFLDVGDDVRLHYVTAGSRSASKGLLLFVHGFPEFWYSWRAQLHEFSRDYYCVAIDMRGYNTSSKPEGKEAYDVDLLCRDVERVVHGLGFKECTLVGHDWGGMVCWLSAYRYPALVRRLITMNIPHPALFTPSNMSLKQFARSYYILLFQLPSLPEWLLSRNNYGAVTELFREPAIDKTHFGDEELECYKHAWSHPGALTAMINYYRQVWSRLSSGSMSGATREQLQVPTLLIWGEEDHALTIELTHGTEKYVRDLTLKYVPKCSHWVQQEQPETVNRLMRKWLESGP